MASQQRKGSQRSQERREAARPSLGTATPATFPRPAAAVIFKRVKLERPRRTFREDAELRRAGSCSQRRRCIVTAGGLKLRPQGQLQASSIDLFRGGFQDLANSLSYFIGLFNIFSHGFGID